MDPSILQDPVVMQNMASLVTSLATLAAKGTASAVSAKIASLKEMKSADTVRKAYDELISELIDERAEAIRIAQAYKEELERVQISDEDIESLNATIGRVLDIFGMSPDSPLGDDPEAMHQRQTYDQVRQLINADTLRTMQLLGFNYKAAIGQPLTELCAAKIKELGKQRGNAGGKGNRPRRGNGY